MKKRIILSIFALVLVAVAASAGVGVGLSAARAQTVLPTIFLTWQAASYVPQGYAGKALPISDTRVTVAADLIDKGTRVDLSSMNILWYLNDVFYQGGVGMVRASFTAPHYVGPTSVKVRVFIPDYTGGPGKTIVVPVTTPQITINSSAPDLSAAAVPFRVTANPYFFNVKDPSALFYNWSLNNAGVGSGQTLTVTRDMAQNGSATLEVQAGNPAQAIERTLKDITLFPGT